MSEVRRLKQLEDENRRLKQLAADLSLDKTMLQDVLSKKNCKACTQTRAPGLEGPSFHATLPEYRGRAGRATDALNRDTTYTFDEGDNILTRKPLRTTNSPLN